jgi:prepilin-type N-terminal cleavage/methylation domain-containing protein
MPILRAGIWTRKDGRCHASGAFTLIELIVVLIVLGVSARIVFPRLDGLLLREPEPWRSGRRFMRVAKYAQELAVATESRFVLSIDVETGRYWVTGPQSGKEAAGATIGPALEGQFSGGVTVADVQVPGGHWAAESTLAVRFSPEGWCDPALIRITSSEGRTVQIVIGEWFGQIELIGDDPTG